ncbi:MurR/RpiR family transcriptional regulator [Lactiplantibacillus garii]|uniref:MurR/RpiR family transcriptional regulator n=1 Tax=Lactiplantibacillus garii TaxID=2306423 RepID=A0A426D636_9LACO|nr:MurR/RpiR family transcriptional regulator [Lactiplantibacillus garii]RRK10082.1 MurR/RpiR family transcriptional regulator [Lactiplantibacillus garii]
MTVLTALQQQLDFTATERRIANYMLTHLDKMPTVLIKELAAATYTSHSAIIRLAQKLGYHGFRDFQRALTTAAAQVQPTDVNANFPFSDTDSVATIAKKMAALNVTAVQTTRQQLDTRQVALIAQQLTRATRILLFSQGDSQLRARSFQNKLVKINRFAIIADEYADDAWNAANLTTDDVAFFISYAGTTQVHRQFAHYLKAHHVPVIVLTGNPQAPLLADADLRLVTVQSETHFAKVGTFASQAAFEYVLDTLFATMYAQDFQTNLARLKTNQRLMADNGPLATK